MRNSAVTQMNHAKRFSPFLDLAEFAEFISEKDNRRLCGFRRCIFCSRRPVGDAALPLFSRQRDGDASHSEAATAEESGTLQTEAVCFPFLATQVTDRFAHYRPAQRVPLARLHNLAAYLLRACLSFHNDPDRKAGRRSLRRSRS